MDITTVFGTVIGGSNPPGDTREIEDHRGYGLVVEYVLAKDETGVRLSLPAFGLDYKKTSPLKILKTVDNSVDCVHKRHNGQNR